MFVFVAIVINKKVQLLKNGSGFIFLQVLTVRIKFYFMFKFLVGLESGWLKNDCFYTVVGVIKARLCDV